MDSASMALTFEFENDSLAVRKKVGRELKPEITYAISTIDEDFNDRRLASRSYFPFRGLLG